MKSSEAINVIHTALTSYVEDSSGVGTPETKELDMAWETVRSEVEDKEDWGEIHFMIVEAITTADPRWRATSKIARVENGEEGQSSGTGALWQLAHDLTDKFLKLYKEKELEGDEFQDAFEQFLDEELK
jgi:hypothetical protein